MGTVTSAMVSKRIAIRKPKLNNRPHTAMKCARSPKTCSGGPFGQWLPILRQSRERDDAAGDGHHDRSDIEGERQPVRPGIERRFMRRVGGIAGKRGDEIVQQQLAKPEQRRRDHAEPEVHSPTGAGCSGAVRSTSVSAETLMRSSA